MGRIEHGGYSHSAGFTCPLCVVDRLIEIGVPEDVVRPVREWIEENR